MRKKTRTPRATQGMGMGGAWVAISQPEAVPVPTRAVHPCGPPYPCRSLLRLGTKLKCEHFERLWKGVKNPNESSMMKFNCYSRAVSARAVSGRHRWEFPRYMTKLN